MGKFDNLNDSQIPELLRRIERLERATPMNNAAIGRGGFEVYDGGTINVSSGNLIVNGTATIDGVLNADGTVTLSGTVAISGPLTISGTTSITGNTDITGDTTVTGDFEVTGPTHLNGVTDVAGNTTVTGNFTTNGPMKTTGTLSVEGVTTLKNDLNVTSGGKIKAGNVTIDPTYLGGAISFVGGAAVAANGDTLALTAPTGVAIATPLLAEDWVYMTGIPASSTKTANLHVAADGSLWRVT